MQNKSFFLRSVFILLLASLSYGISAQDNPCPYDTVALYFDKTDLEVVQGDQFCVDVMVDHFENIAQIIFFVNYSSSVVRLDSYDPLVSMLPGIDQGAIAESDEQAAFAWGSPNLEGSSLPDGSKLVTLCFTVIGDPGEDNCIQILTRTNLGGGGAIPADFAEYEPECPGEIEVLPSTGKMCVTSIPAPSDTPLVYVTDQCGSDDGNVEGRVELRVFYGVAPYMIRLSNGETIETMDGNIVVENLPNDDYTVFVTDSEGKVSETVSFTLDNTPRLTIDPLIFYPDCHLDNRGSITLTVAGGKEFRDGNYRYDWDDKVSGKGRNKITRLSSGIYNVIVEDSLGCKIEQQFDLTVEPISLKTLDIRPALCLGSRRGLVEIEFEGGAPDRDYVGRIVGADGSTDFFQDLDGPTTRSLLPNDYTIYVSNRSGLGANDECLFSFPFTIGVQRELGVQVLSSEDGGCPDGQLMHEIAINRESTPDDVFYNVEILKDGASIYDEITNQATLSTPCLDTGRYIVRLFDTNNGCEAFDTIFLLPNTIEIELSDVSSPECQSDSLGAISIAATTEHPPLLYEWSNGVSGIDSSEISNLVPGTYYVTLTDSTGLSLRDSFVVTSGDTLALDLESEAILCPGGLGAIRAIGTSSSGSALSYSWSPDPTGQTGSILPDVPAGTYTVTMTNEDGCFIMDSISISEPSGPNAEVSNINAPRCAGIDEGTATILVIENDSYKEPFFFASSSGESHMGNNFNLSALPSGPNWVVYSDGVCTFDTVYFTVPEASPFALDTVSYVPIQCHGGSTIINLKEINDEPVTYTWLYDNTVGNVRTDVTAGTYAIELSKDGCSAIDSFTVVEPPILEARIDTTLSMLAACGGDGDAILVASVSGGVTSTGEYDYNWIDGITVIGIQSTLDSVAPGTYVLRVKDDNECEMMDTIIVTEPAPVIAEVGSVIDPQCSGDLGTITISSATGGVGGPYLYQVNTSPTLPITDTAQVVPGDLTVRVFDQNGCSWDTMVSVIPASPVSLVLGPDENIELGETVELTATIMTDAIVDMISWSPADSITCLDDECSRISVAPVLTTTYTATVTTVDGCMASDELIVNVDRTSNVYIPNAISPNGTDSDNQIFKVYGGAGVQGINLIRIYDRWGGLVHREDGNQPVNANGVGSWRGIHQGTSKVLQPGVYTYHVEISFLDGGPTETRRGTVTLLR